MIKGLRFWRFRRQSPILECLVKSDLSRLATCLKKRKHVFSGQRGRRVVPQVLQCRAVIWPDWIILARWNIDFHQWRYPKMAGLFHGKSKKIKWMMTRGYPYLRKSPNIPFWCPKMGEISQSWHLNSKSDEESCGIGVLNFTQSISSCGIFWGCRIGKVNILHIK